MEDLISLITKFKSQPSFEKELIDLVTANKNYSELFSNLKLNSTKITKLEPISVTKRKMSITGIKKH